MRACSVLLAAVFVSAGVVPAAAQTQEVGSQCGCDLQAGRIIRQPANQDCHSYCCSTYGGKWCGAGKPGVAAPGSTGAALIQTFGNIMGAWAAQKEHKKREREALEAQRAAELERELEQQRLREQQQRAQFEREKQGALAQMKGPRPDLIGMKPIGPSAAQVARQRELRGAIAAKLRLLNETLDQLQGKPADAGEARVAGADPPRAEPPRFTQFLRPEQGDPVEIGIKGLEEAGLRDFQLRAASERRQSPDRIVDPYERALLRDPEYLEASQELTRAESALDDALRRRAAADDVDGAILSLAMAQERLADVRARTKVRR